MVVYDNFNFDGVGSMHMHRLNLLEYIPRTKHAAHLPVREKRGTVDEARMSIIRRSVSPLGGGEAKVVFIEKI